MNGTLVVAFEAGGGVFGDVFPFDGGVGGEGLEGLVGGVFGLVTPGGFSTVTLGVPFEGVVILTPSTGGR